jgi:hypothetical protein
MDFLLRIFFSGLIAFVPSRDGKELTVLLLDTHAHATSDGMAVAHHQPMLITRAQDCDGDCDPREPRIAQFLFADLPASRAADALAVATDGGGAWLLDRVELSIRGAGGALQPPLVLQTSASSRGKAVPTTSAEREDFAWVPDLKRVLPSFGAFNPALFGPRPPRGVVATRLRLTSGRVFTYRLIRVDGKVMPIHFRAGARDVAYAQAVAGWVAAEIRVPGESVEVVARSFDDGSERTMKLTPRDGVVEMAVLNLPPYDVPAPGAKRTPKPGSHFEMFYTLAAKPAAANRRPVPYVRATSVQADFDALHPRDTLWSPLLEKLRFEPGRGPYDVVLCPVGGGWAP